MKSFSIIILFKALPPAGGEGLGGFLSGSFLFYQHPTFTFETRYIQLGITNLTLMQKIFFLSAFFLLTFYAGFSQKNNELLLSFGPSFPGGDYSKADIMDPTSGFGSVGEQLSISYTRNINAHWGAIALLSGQRNPLNTTAAANDYSQYQYDGFTNWEFDKVSWKMANLFVGIEARFPLNKNNTVSLKLKAMGGVVYIGSINEYQHASTDTSEELIENLNSDGWGFGGSLSAGVSYDLNKKYFLEGTAQLLLTNSIQFQSAQAKAIAVETTSSGYIISTTSSYSTMAGSSSQSFESFNVTAGIGMRF
jgi:hypothetical protein